MLKSNKRYKIVYADPAWDISYVTYLVPQELPYKTMADEEIMGLPIRSIVDDNVILFLWCIDSKIPLIQKLMKCWGFEYKGVGFVWHKVCKYKRGQNSTYGGHTRRSCEFCFIGTRGLNLIKRRDIEQYVGSPRREHSRKPDEVRKRIVQMCGDLPRIDIFARQRRRDWDVFGDEISKEEQEVLR